MPFSESVMLVRFDLNTGVCKPNTPLLDTTTYAIDIRTMRILSRDVLTRRNPEFHVRPPSPPENSGEKPPSTDGSSFY
ncbi:MAG TPA: hypothetical protein VNA24_09320 [Hyalangium sp.]|nr:hypothetical protein [Hyalangium sp.]